MTTSALGETAAALAERAYASGDYDALRRAIEPLAEGGDRDA